MAAASLVRFARGHRHEGRLEDDMLQPVQVTLVPQQRFQLVEQTRPRRGMAEVGMHGLEPIEPRCQRMLIAGSPARGNGALPIVEGKIELQPVGRDGGKACEQVRRCCLVAQ